MLMYTTSRLSVLVLWVLLVAQGTVSQNVFRVGYIYPTTGPFASNSLIVRDAHMMWMKNVNDRGGLLINGTSYNVTFGFKTILWDPVDARNGTEDFIQEFQPHFLLLPHSSFLGAITAEVASNHKINNILTASGSPSVFECDSNLLAPCDFPFGRRMPYSASLTIPATNIMVEGLNLLVIENIKTIALYWDESELSEAVAAGARRTIELLGLELVYNTSVPNDFSDPEKQIVALTGVIQDLQDIKPDVVIAATYSSCANFLEIAKAVDFNANAYLMMHPCAGFEQFKEDTQFVLVAGEVWDRRLKTDIYDESDPRVRYHHFLSNRTTTSAQRFASEFNELYGMYPGYNGMAGYTEGYIIQHAMETANSFDPDVIQDVINTISISGFCGPYSFDQFGESTRQGITYQIGEDFTNEIVAPLFGVTKQLVYPVPTWSQRHTTYGWYKRASERVILAAVAFVMLTTLGLMIWVFAYRTHRVIRAAQPLFVVLTLLGTMLMYGAVAFWTLHTDDAHCNLVRWLLGIGFGLTYGAIFARIYRIGEIFLTKSLDVFKLTNMMIIPIVAGIVAIEAVILTIWTIVSRSRAVLEIADPYIKSDDYYSCTHESTADKVFLGIISAFNIAVLLYGVYLAARIWKLRAVLYNESKYIGFAVYTLTFFIIIIVIVQVFGHEHRELAFILRSVCLILGPFVSVLALLVPRMYYMNIDISEEQMGTSRNTSNRSGRSNASESMKQTVTDLNKKVKDLQAQLASYTELDIEDTPKKS